MFVSVFVVGPPDRCFVVVNKANENSTLEGPMTQAEAESLAKRLACELFSGGDVAAPVPKSKDPWGDATLNVVTFAGIVAMLGGVIWLVWAMGRVLEGHPPW